MADTAYDATRGKWVARGQGLLDGTETLRLTVWNGAPTLTVRLSGRIRTLDGRIVPFVETLVPATDRTASTLDRPMVEGELLGVSARVSVGTSRDGWTYAVIELGTGSGSAFQALDVLAADCITATRRASWPGGFVRGPLDSSGFLRSISGTTPAAGAEVTESVPTGARWDIIAFRAQLITSATVANRIPELAADDGANIYFQSANSVNHTASTTIRYSWSAGFGGLVNGVGNEQGRALPDILTLAAGSRLRTITGSIQVGDQWSGVQYLVRERIEGA